MLPFLVLISAVLGARAQPPPDDQIVLFPGGAPNETAGAYPPETRTHNDGTGCGAEPTVGRLRIGRRPLGRERRTPLVERSLGYTRASRGTGGQGSGVVAVVYNDSSLFISAYITLQPVTISLLN